ncbi:MAG: IgGFc-binding protein [Nitrospirales bacterium]
MFHAIIKPFSLMIFGMLLLMPVTPAWGALDHQGTEFILGFLPNMFTQDSTELHLISDVATSVTVEYPVNDPTFISTIAVSPGTITVVTIPMEAATVWTAGAVRNNAVHAFASEEFVAYMTNGTSLSKDAALGLPVDTMNTTYRVLSALPSQLVASDRSQFVVVAGFDGTEVTITPTGAMAGGFAAGTPFTITLNKGEGFLGQGTTSGTSGDISGTLIQATRPVGMTNGNVCTNVPQDVPFCDHVFEVAQPVQTWGLSTLVGNLPQKTGGSIYRIMASEDGTNVTEDGVALTTLNAGQVFTTPELPGNHVFEGDKPIFVAQLMTSHNAGVWPFNGDPAMGNMIPSTQYSTHYTLSTGTGFADNFSPLITAMALR